MNEKNHDNLKMHYKTNLEIGYIISFIFFILLFILFPRFGNREFQKVKKISLIEVIDIPLISEYIPPLPPSPSVDIRNKQINNQSVTYLPEALKNDIRNDELKLDINTNYENYLMGNSQLGDIFKINYQSHNRDNYTISSVEYENIKHGISYNNKTQLSLKISKPNVTAKGKIDDYNFSSNEIIKYTENSQENITKNNTDLNNYISVENNQFLLKESESTIGTDEYKTWNRISSSIDRLNKGRYGDLPKNMKRIANGLIITFDYKNGKRHEIFWSKGGKLIIRVTGTSPKNQFEELAKACDSIFELIYKLNI